MRTEEGTSNLGNNEIQCLKRKAVSDEVPISNGNGVAEEARHSKSEAGNDEAVFSIGNGVGEEVQHSNSEAGNDGAVFSNGNGVGEEVQHSNSEAVSNWAVFANGDGVAEEVQHSNTEAMNDRAVFSNGNDVAEEVQHSNTEAVNDGSVFANGNGVTEEVQHSKSEAVNDGTVFANGNGVAEEVQHLKSEAMSDGSVFSNGNGVADVARVLKSDALDNGVNGNGVIEEDGFLKSESISNGVAVTDGFDSGDGGSSGVSGLRTYKRRRYDKSSSKGKAQEDCKKCAETASHTKDQVVKKSFDATLGNTADDCVHRHWGNVVLKHLYQSLGNDNGVIEGCIGEALIHHPQISCATTVMQGTSKIGKDGQEFSSQFDRLSHRTRTEANGHAHVMQNGSSSEPHGHGVTERCQRVLCNILTSEKFSSLSKILLENFHGMKPESVLDFSVMASRMKQKTYEQSPALFLSDIQQVWRKLQDNCNEIFALAKSLSHMSATSYSELVGVSTQSTFEDEKQVESDSHMKPEPTEECATYKSCCCSHCGEMADDTDCLVCDSCEKMYHLSCIEPAVKEIPHKSWYCANCTTGGIGSPHANCVVCARLNDTKITKKIVGDESLPTNEETLNEFEENSNCSYDGIEVSTGEEKTLNCKVCGNEAGTGKIRICGHPFCPSKNYHVRCLASKQLKSYSHWWYCPSCLCQVCLTDQDDDQIVLCDGCDHAHHIYCMKPPRTSVPEGKWFCRKCDAGMKAISQAKKAYERNKLRTGKNVSKPNANNENNCNSKRVVELERGGGMDMLLTAANSLNFE